MEELLFLADIAGLVEFLIAAASVGLGVLGTLMFGRRYKQRIAALETRPAIHQVFNVRDDVADQERELRDAIAAGTTQGLHETIRSLPQHPLGEGHTFAELPAGTRLVSMADGSFRLAMPVRLSGIGISVGLGSATAHSGDDPPEGGQS